jgi:hypothetical protein
MGASVTLNAGPQYWHPPAELLNKATGLPWHVAPKLKRRAQPAPKKDAGAA